MPGHEAPSEPASNGAPGSFRADWTSGCLVVGLAVVALAVLAGPWTLLAPLLVAAFMGRLWWRRGRDPEREAVAVRYEPPDGLGPTEVGILVDHAWDVRDVTAALVDLAMRGYLEIRREDTPAEGGEATRGGAEGDEAEGDAAEGHEAQGGETDGTYVFVRTSEPEDWQELRRHEADLLYALFREGSFTEADVSAADIGARDVLSGLVAAARGEAPLDLQGMENPELVRMAVAGRVHGGQLVRALYGEGRERVSMSELEDSFYGYVAGLQTGILDRMVELGYYARRPGARRGIYLLAGMAVLFFGSTNEGGGILPLVSTLLSAAVIAGVGWAMPSRTVRGARAYARALGFREFLSRVEEDRFRRMIRGPEDFERYLPYAIALGVDRAWAEAFEPIYSQGDRELAGGGEREGVDWAELRDRFREKADRLGLGRLARRSGELVG